MFVHLLQTFTKMKHRRAAQSKLAAGGEPIFFAYFKLKPAATEVLVKALYICFLLKFQWYHNIRAPLNIDALPFYFRNGKTRDTAADEC